MQQYSFFFLYPPLTKCALSFLYFSVCWKSTPLPVTTHCKTWTTLALGSRDLGSNGVKAKSRRGVFPRLGWKVWLRLGSHGDTGKERRGGKGKEGKCISGLMLLGQSAGPCIKKRPPHSRWAHWQMYGRKHNAGDLSNRGQILWNGECKDCFKKIMCVFAREFAMQ